MVLKRSRVARRQEAPHVLVAAEAVGEDQRGLAVSLDLDVVALAKVHVTGQVAPGRAKWDVRKQRSHGRLRKVKP